jgi:hypothetical protein
MSNDVVAPAPRAEHGRMYAQNTYVIRQAGLADVPRIARLGWLYDDTWPSGRILVGELDGVVAAALAVDENRAVCASMPGAPLLLAHLRARAAGLLALGRTPSLEDRIRERIGVRLPAAW